MIDGTAIVSLAATYSSEDQNTAVPRHWRRNSGKVPTRWKVPTMVSFLARWPTWTAPGLISEQLEWKVGP
jgi:hypothetical protein